MFTTTSITVTTVYIVRPHKVATKINKTFDEFTEHTFRSVIKVHLVLRSYLMLVYIPNGSAMEIHHFGLVMSLNAIAVFV